MRLRHTLVLPYGRDEEEQGQDPSSSGQEPEEDKQDGLTTEDALSALSAARAEAAKYRKRAQAAEAKVEDHKKAQMSELEKAQEAAREAEAKAQAAEDRARQLVLDAEVTKAASRKGFYDPADVIPHLDIEELTLAEDGKPDGRSLNAALERLAKDKPYLVKPASAGSGDGGAKGSGPKAKTWDDRVDEVTQELEKHGMVRVPGA